MIFSAFTFFNSEYFFTNEFYAISNMFADNVCYSNEVLNLNWNDSIWDKESFDFLPPKSIFPQVMLENNDSIFNFVFFNDFAHTIPFEFSFKTFVSNDYILWLNNNLILNQINWNSAVTITFVKLFEIFASNTSQISTLSFDNVSYFDNLTNMTSLYHYSIPNTKLAYPEPFIASASFMHTDLWFVHILIYQYWLWFVFVFLIIFFFLTFVSVVRWCNMRIRPRRETRGVSRSKCGDLITACVPVSWAASIIVNESTDAIDFYDGFGTSELVIGIRAYQWGWEYYYPKDIDLNYNLKKNYSTFIGNSVKYNVASRINLQTTNLWKFYQNKTSDHSVLPAYFLTFSNDNYNLLSFLNFNDIGSNILQETSAFRKTKSFFKFANSNTFFFNSPLSNFYKNLSNIYFEPTTVLTSSIYNLKRQHSHFSSLTNNSAKLTFLNQKNFLKFLNYNLKHKKTTLFSNNYSSHNFFNNLQPALNSLFALYFQKIFNKHSLACDFFLVSKLETYASNASLINLNTDKKKLSHPFFKLFNRTFWKKNNFNSISYNQLSFNKDFSYLTNSSLDQQSIIKKKNSFVAANDALLTPSKSVRNFINTSASVPTIGRLFFENTISMNQMLLKTQNTIDTFHTYNYVKLGDMNLSFFAKLASNKIYLEAPVSPINSSNSFLSAIEYDNSKTSNISNIPVVLQGKEDLLANWITSTYWNFYNNTSNLNTRVENNYTYQNFYFYFYFPLFNFSYDYDFRNWQSIELLEDTFWESSFPAFVYDEYLTLFNDFYETMPVSKHDALSDFTPIQQSNFLNDVLVDNSALPIYFDETLLNAQLFKNENFFLFPAFPNLNNLDDTYEALKTSALALIYANNVFLNNSLMCDASRSLFLVTNFFRSDYEDLNWEQDHYYAQSLMLPIIHEIAPKSASLWDLPNDNSAESTSRFDNSIHLRDTTKNAIVTYNALQKVFRTRFDEGRSNAKLLEFANFYEKQPYLSTSRVLFEKTLGKTKTNFYKTNFYKNLTEFNPNVSNTLSNSLNYYIYDFPFLLANKSDASRHVWFDWFSKWGFCEIQPSSSARYAIHGMPHFNKFFNFTSGQNEMLNETESYLLRLSKARRNYLPNWAYTPYFYAKNNLWYKNNLFFSMVSYYNKLNQTNFYLIEALKYSEKLVLKNHSEFFFTPSVSNVNSYAKNLWKPFSNTASYYYNMSALFDILTRREFLYRQFLLKRNKIVNLPQYATNNANNELALNIKTLFMYADPIVYNNEYSREFYHNTLSLFNFYYVKNTIDSINASNPIFNNFFYYFFSANRANTLSVNSFLYKNQYRPLRKGINNMLRLHATGAIAMPIEIRLQILASSKDVIHSWAIPSAGIKIDCVPGYSSHKIMIFLVSGIFWGQCMEICGRYHHWMPIVVYFMKRDLFFLWCTHFVFNTNNAANFSNDRQYNNSIQPVSYDKNSWLTELLN